MKHIAIVAAFIAALAFSFKAEAQINPYTYSGYQAAQLSKDMPTMLVRSNSRVYINGHKASMQELRSCMTQRDFRKFRIGKALYDVTFPVSCVGAVAAFAGMGGCVAYLVEGNGNETLCQYSVGAVLGGLGCIIVALPFEMVGLVKMDKAVDRHNGRNTGISFSPATSGLGIKMSF